MPQIRPGALFGAVLPAFLYSMDFYRSCDRRNIERKNEENMVLLKIRDRQNCCNALEYIMYGYEHCTHDCWCSGD